MKKSKTGSFISLAIMLAVGVFLVLNPGDTLITAARIIGAALIVLGVIGIISPFIRKEDKNVLSIVMYAVEVIAGIIILASPAFVISLYPIIVGAIIALYGISDMMSALQMRKADIGSWKAALVLAIISVIFGVVILLNPFSTVSALVRIVGVVLIYKAIAGIFIRIKL